ncbi:hypothetical protein ENUP19_0310G0007 [Entamoeba nuttalli]|uniref:Protein kinase domain-containing protein n=1 Tax=Entamoeba nuttalli TaxID=412467 RepID=A0ABQ0DVP0_9EUKA
MLTFLLIIVISNATESINNKEERNKEIIHTQIYSNTHKRMYNLYNVQLKGEDPVKPATAKGAEEPTSSDLSTKEALPTSEQAVPKETPKETKMPNVDSTTEEKQPKDIPTKEQQTSAETTTTGETTKQQTENQESSTPKAPQGENSDKTQQQQKDHIPSSQVEGNQQQDQKQSETQTPSTQGGNQQKEDDNKNNEIPKTQDDAKDKQNEQQNQKQQDAKEKQEDKQEKKDNDSQQKNNNNQQTTNNPEDEKTHEPNKNGNKELDTKQSNNNESETDNSTDNDINNQKNIDGTSCKEIEFHEGEEIQVNEEIRELICIGNSKKEKMKIQISSKEENEKYSIRTNPNVITIEGGYACEFELFITIKCTTKIKDKIMIISKTLNKAQEETIKSISISGETEISTRLDPDEIKEEKKIGEGSFGIVYVGEIRGNKVAIKKMKQVEENEDKNKRI